jgi:hypothetical protein
MSLRGRVLVPLRNRLGGLPQRLAFWAAEAFDFAPDPRVTLTLHTRRLARRFLTGNMAALGGAYVSGELATDGRIEDALLLGIGIAERVGRSRLADWAACPARHSKASDAADLRCHYDLSNYWLWLDRLLPAYSVTKPTA